MPDLLIDSVWPGLAAWALLYTSDYALTIWGATLYQKHARTTIAFEGSIELTPVYQQDVDALRVVSPRFLFYLTMYLTVIALSWRFVRASFPELHAFFLGTLLLLELAVHVRHLRNLALFRAIAKGDGIQGRIEYSRATALRLSMIELTAFAGTFFVIFLFTWSSFVLGGAIACLAVAQQHRELAWKADSRRRDEATASAS